MSTSPLGTTPLRGPRVPARPIIQCPAPCGADNRRRASFPVGGRSRESLDFCCSRPNGVTSPFVQFFSERRSVGPGGPERPGIPWPVPARSRLQTRASAGSLFGSASSALCTDCTCAVIAETSRPCPAVSSPRRYGPVGELAPEPGRQVVQRDLRTLRRHSVSTESHKPATQQDSQLSSIALGGLLGGLDSDRPADTRACRPVITTTR